MIRTFIFRVVVLCFVAINLTPTATLSTPKPYNPEPRDLVDFNDHFPQLVYEVPEPEPVLLVDVKLPKPEPKPEIAPKPTVKNTAVILTNYYANDGSSGTTTASGLSINDFQIHPTLKAYTYNNRIVVATSNMTRLQRPLNAGYRTFELYDEFILEIQGIDYPAVVLDVCGACYGVKGESKQRIDVFTTGSVFGKINGTLKEKIQ